MDAHDTLGAVVAPDEEDELGLTAITAVVPNGSGEDILSSHLQLLVIGNGTFATHPLQETGALTLGRSSGCDIPVNCHSISRRHATLTLGERVLIQDVGSANGTFVRGQRISPDKPTEISVGELVGLGNASIILQRRSQPVRARMLWTHDYFEARLDEECAREARSGTSFALLRIHPDRRAPASFVEETLAELLRESDILGKYGPNAYEALLPDTTPAQTDEAVRRLVGSLLERGLKCRIFAACCPRDGRSPYQLAAKAQPAAKEKPTAAASDLVIADAHMQSLYRLVEQIAVSDICVLLLGETGAGKEVFSRAIHHASPRAAGPFVEVNCATLTETLLESELFGHERGAFTNAVAAKPGLLELAHGGTLFLDEIGDMPLSTQVKLLRVIEDSHVRRVGGLKSLAIDVRFVAATNSDVETQVAQGAFRRDLFFRLNGVTIVIPPLRERTGEIEPLARMFIDRAKRAGPRPALSPEALQLLRDYSWPGNVRELKNVVERAVLLCGGGPILPEHLSVEKMRGMRTTTRSGKVPILPAAWAARRAREGDTPPMEPAVPAAAPARPPGVPPPIPTQPRKGSEEEQRWILQALERANGNQTVAARLLGISRRTLVSRLNEYADVDRPRKGKKRDDS